MVRAGLDLPAELLALACASHSGEDFHVAGVREILAGAGLDESALQTPPDFPLDDAAREAILRAGGSRGPVLMNCSGKHAAMLATCVANGWDVATYRQPDHPLQVAIADTFAEMTGEPVEAVAVDGCGAPLLSTSLTGLARAFRRLALGLDGHDHPTRRSARVADAIRQHPAYVSGSESRRAGAADRDPRSDRQGRRRVVLRPGPPRRPGVRAQDRRRRRPGPAGADGRRPRAQRRARRRRRRRRRGTPDRPRRPARRRAAGRGDPGLFLRVGRSGFPRSAGKPWAGRNNGHEPRDSRTNPPEERSRPPPTSSQHSDQRTRPRSPHDGGPSGRTPRVNTVTLAEFAFC